MEEQWRAVVGYEGAYEVSNLGRVRSVDRVTTHGRRWRGRMLRQRTTCWGYAEVQLRWGDQPEHKKIHTMVLEAFVGPRPEGLEARHRDDDKSNNQLDNLMWGTSAENKADAIANGRFARGERSGLAKIRDADVLIVLQAVIEAPTRVVAQRFGVSSTAVSHLVQRRTFAHVSVPDALVAAAQRALASRRHGHSRA